MEFFYLRDRRRSIRVIDTLRFVIYIASIIKIIIKIRKIGELIFRVSWKTWDKSTLFDSLVGIASMNFKNINFYFRDLSS